MRLEPVRLPDFLDAADRNFRPPLPSRAPVRRIGRPFGCRLRHHLSDHHCRQWLFARRAGLVPQQAVNADFAEPPLPAPDRRFRLARAPHDLHRTNAIRRQQDDLGTPGMLLRGVSVRDPFVQPNPILRRKLNRNAGSHAPRIARTSPSGNRSLRLEHERN